METLPLTAAKGMPLPWPTRPKGTRIPWRRELGGQAPPLSVSFLTATRLHLRYFPAPRWNCNTVTKSHSLNAVGWHRGEVGEGSQNQGMILPTGFNPTGRQQESATRHRTCKPVMIPQTVANLHWSISQPSSPAHPTLSRQPVTGPRSPT